AEWLTTLMSGDATPVEKTAWQQWRQAHPDHERAWKHIESASGGLRELDAQAGRQRFLHYRQQNVQPTHFVAGKI
ncbi:MAG: FecR/PupR family sigma factor regulator, partial [Janthinobacterium sp.]